MNKKHTTDWKGWEKTRSQGRTRFVWLYGVLGFGIPMTFVVAALNIAGHQEDILVFLPFVLAMSLLGGHFLGSIFWEIVEVQYLHAKAQEVHLGNREVALAILKRSIKFFILVTLLTIMFIAVFHLY